MSTDENYTWIIDSDEIDDEFRDRIADRLYILKNCVKYRKTPEKSYTYDFECNLCNFNKTGICSLCDIKEFDLQELCDRISYAGPENKFDEILKLFIDKYGVVPGQEGSK